MDESVLYNVSINELKTRKASLEKEVSQLIIEKDKILNEIRDQRNGKTVVHTETEKKKEERDNILSQLDTITKDLYKGNLDFHNTVDKRLTQLNILENRIKEKEEIDKSYTIKREQLNGIIDEIQKKSLLLKEMSFEIQNNKSESEKTKMELIDMEKKLIVREQKIKENEDRLFENQRNLDKKQKDLALKEKRLDKLHEELKHNKK